MEEDKKKTMLPIIVGVITLLVLVIGATYAYFAVGLSNNFGTTTISASAEDVGTVTLSNINSTLSMNLTAADMMRNGSVVCRVCLSRGKGGYCATYGSECLPGTEDCECTGEYNSVEYFATPTGKTDIYTMDTEIGRATVSPNTDTNYYSCDYTLSITTSGTNNMYTAFNNMPEEDNATQARPNAYKSSEQVVFQINDDIYDWYDDGMPSTYTGNMIVSKDNSGHITAGLMLVNNGDIDQTDLAGTDVSISIQATNFSCVAVPVTYAYFNATNENNPLNAPNNMPYYIKQTSVNSTVVNNILCGVFGTTTVCFPYNAGAEYEDYYTQLTTLGATCTYEKDDMNCTYGDLYCSMNIVDSNFAFCRYNDTHECSITSSEYRCDSFN